MVLIALNENSKLDIAIETSYKINEKRREYRVYQKFHFVLILNVRYFFSPVLALNIRYFNLVLSNSLVRSLKRGEYY